MRVARALALALVPGVAGPALPRPTQNADAWDAYLRGRYWLHRGGADVAQSLEPLETAVSLDSRFAAGWAELAEARHVLVMTGGMAPLDAYPRAREAARRALTLDETLADAHVAAGSVQLWFDWQPAEAARSFERALALNPSHAAAHHDYAWSLVGARPLRRRDRPHHDGARSRSAVVARQHRHRLALPASAAADRGRARVSAHPRDSTRVRSTRRPVSNAPSCSAASTTRRCARRSPRLPKDVDVVVPPATPVRLAIACWRSGAGGCSGWRPSRTAGSARTRSPYTWRMLGDTDRALEQLELAYDRRAGHDARS